MPQQIDAKLFQTPYRKNIWGQIVAPAASAAMTSIAQAGAGLLGDLIHEDPKEAFLKEKANALRSESAAKEQAGYQNWLASGGEGRQNSPENRRAYGRSIGKSEDQMKDLDTVWATDTSTGKMQQVNTLSEGMPSETKAFVQPSEASISIPRSAPPPAAEENLLMGPDTGAPAPRPLAPVGVAQTAKGPSAAVEQVAKDQAAAADVVAPIVQNAPDPTPLPPQPVKTQDPPAPPLSPQEAANVRANATLGIQRLQGNLAQLAQARQAFTTGAVDPKQVAMAASMVNQTKATLNEVIQNGNILRGAAPELPSGLTWADSALQLRAHIDLQNPAAVQALTKAGMLEATKARAAQWDHYAPSLSLTQINSIGDVAKNLAPGVVGTTAYHNIMLGQTASEQAQQKITNQNNQTKVTQAQGWVALDQNQQKIATEAGLTNAQASHLTAQDAELLATQPYRLAEYRINLDTSRANLDLINKGMGYKLDSMRISNIAAKDAMVTTRLSTAAKMAGLMYSSDQANSLAQLSAIKIATDYKKTLQTKQEDLRMSAGVEAVGYSKDPKTLKEAVGKLGPDETQKYNEYLHEGIPANQALAAVHYSDYGKVLLDLKDADKEIALRQAAMNKNSEKDPGMKDLLANINKGLATNPVEAETQRRAAVGESRSKTLQSGTELTRASVVGKPTDVAMKFFLENPESIWYALGKARVVDGNVKFDTLPVGNRQAVGLFQLQRGMPGLTQELFEAHTTQRKTGEPSQTLKEIFGDKSKEAYALYNSFKGL